MEQIGHLFSGGGIHGVAQVVENTMSVKGVITNRFHIVKRCFVFMFVTLAWIFFRADSFADAIYVISNMFSGVGDLKAYFFSATKQLNLSKLKFCKILVVVTGLLLYEAYYKYIIQFINSRKFAKVIRWGIYYIAIILIIKGFIYHVGENPFVYFQF